MVSKAAVTILVLQELQNVARRGFFLFQSFRSGCWLLIVCWRNGRLGQSHGLRNARFWQSLVGRQRRNWFWRDSWYRIAELWRHRIWGGRIDRVCLRWQVGGRNWMRFGDVFCPLRFLFRRWHLCILILGKGLCVHKTLQCKSTNIISSLMFTVRQLCFAHRVERIISLSGDCHPSGRFYLPIPHITCWFFSFWTKYNWGHIVRMTLLTYSWGKHTKDLRSVLKL